MAQEVQIVPKYQHSHVETYINDYSEYTENTVAYAESPNKFLAVFRSGQGIDNVLIKKTDLSDFYKTYGRSNYSKYGQPLMMPIAMLNSGNASVYCMRVMPDDAFAANCILSMLYKMDEITGKFIIKYRASYIDKSAFEDTKFYRTGEEFKKQLKMYAQALKTNEPDADGFYQIPLVTFREAFTFNPAVLFSSPKITVLAARFVSSVFVRQRLPGSASPTTTGIEFEAGFTVAT